MKKSLFTLSLVLCLSGASFLTQAATPHHYHQGATHKSTARATKPAHPLDQKEEKATSSVSYRQIDPLALLRNADSSIGENITFDGTFVTFSPYALDYKGAMRSSKDYISFLIQRPDVPEHIIPLSELKLVFPRKQVEQVMDLESGDKVQIKGKVFSAALGDPWVDVNEVKILQKTPNSKIKPHDKAAKKSKDLE